MELNKSKWNKKLTKEKLKFKENWSVNPQKYFFFFYQTNLKEISTLKKVILKELSTWKVNFYYHVHWKRFLVVEILQKNPAVISLLYWLSKKVFLFCCKSALCKQVKRNHEKAVWQRKDVPRISWYKNTSHNFTQSLFNDSFLVQNSHLKGMGIFASVNVLKRLWFC